MPLYTRRYFVVFYAICTALTISAAIADPMLAIATTNIPFVHGIVCAIVLSIQGSTTARAHREYLAQNYPDLEKAIFGGQGRIPGGSFAWMSLRSHPRAKNDPRLHELFRWGRRSRRALLLAFLAIPWDIAVAVAAVWAAEQ